MPAQAPTSHKTQAPAQGPRQPLDVSAAAQGRPPGRRGVEIAARLGYGMPVGKVTGAAGHELDKVVTGQLPIWFDLGARVTRELFIGAYLQYGLGIISDDVACDVPGATCLLRDTRLGFQFQQHGAPDADVDLWVGIGAGYEWQTLSIEGGEAGGSVTVEGVEFFNAQLGVDFALSPYMALGPFVSASIGQYSSASAHCEGATCGPSFAASGDIPSTALHGWLMLGMRFNTGTGLDQLSAGRRR